MRSAPWISHDQGEDQSDLTTRARYLHLTLLWATTPIARISGAAIPLILRIQHGS